MNDEPIAERTRWVENRRPPTTQNDVVIDVGRADQEPARSEVLRVADEELHGASGRGCEDVRCVGVEPRGAIRHESGVGRLLHPEDYLDDDSGDLDSDEESDDASGDTVRSSA